MWVQLRYGIVGLAVGNGGFYVKTDQPTTNYRPLPKTFHEDELQGESNSISNQKRILETYAKQNGFSNLRWYTDDGYSGANFQRPGFQAMLADIEAGKVGTVIVKDMSS